MPFEPGQSGNPRGRAIDKPWRDQLRIAAKRTEAETVALLADPTAPMLARAAARVFMQASCDEPDIAASREIGDRLDGKPKQQTELTAGEDGDGNAIPLGLAVNFVAPAKS